MQYGLSNSAEGVGGYRLLRITDIQDNTVEWNAVPFTNINNVQAEKYLLDTGDILFARTGGTVGKSYLVSSLPVEAVFASYLIRVKVLKMNPQYVKFFFESLSYWEQITDKSVGTGQPNVNGTKLKEIVLPIPPLAEQRRIVTAIESAFALIDEIECNKTDLQSAVAAAKSKILSLAICGKLIPQDPNDEPANTLLERIRAERETVVRLSKSKRGKGDSAAITSVDSFYYEKVEGLPVGWVQTTIGNACELLNTENANNGLLPYLEVKYLRGDMLPAYKESGKYIVANTTLILVDGENSGEVFIAHEKGYMGSTFKEMRISSFVDSNYVLYFIKYHQKQLRNNKTGSAIPHLNKKMFVSLALPLPPLKEQRRIVLAVETAFKRIDSISENIN